MSEAAAQPWMNRPAILPEVLRPRMRVMVRGFDDAPRTLPRTPAAGAGYAPPGAAEVELQGAWRASVERGNRYHGDRFTVEAPLYGGPAFGIAWWSNQAFGLMLRIEMQLREGEWRTVTMGHVDRVEAYPETGVVVLEGRDLTARFIETKTQESFPNRTASELVTIIAGRHGIKVRAVPTATPVRSYYVRDNVQFTLDQFARAISEWDLMVALAQYEGFDLFVEGDTLYFQPQEHAPGQPFVVQWRKPLIEPGATSGRESNVSNLVLSRALTLARDIEVVVKSWNSRQGEGFTRTARAIGARSASPARAAVQYGAPTQRFVFLVPNLSEAGAQAYANNQLKILSQSERLIRFSTPGDLRVTPRTMIQVQGTGSDWDQWYHIDNISLNMDFEGGFSMSVSAKNRDTRSEVVLR